LSHLDVVPANPREWSVDPFSGVIKDGFVWGRGATDCKDLVAIETVVMKLLARNRVKPKGDIIFAATADEEKGGVEGVQWLMKNCPDKIKANYVINEGAGFSFPIGGRHFFTVQTSEKGVIWTKIKAGGSPGHGSKPGLADNAILRMTEVIHRLVTHKFEVETVPTVRHFIQEFVREKDHKTRFFRELLEDPSSADLILDEMAKTEKGMAEMLRAMLRTTIAPTMISGGVKENIIPSECEATFDCRILPGQTVENLLQEIKNVLKGIDKLQYSFIQSDEPNESPFDTPLFDLIRKTLKDFVPDCSVVPFMTTGATDSRYLRLVNSVCYGLQPAKADLPLDEFLRTEHGTDERRSVNNLVFGVSVLYQIVSQLME
jgi:acetylornithine deacetylase/succinyl-diaminopimelate desuccinylase-like protein